MRIPRARQNNPSFYRRPYGTGCATPAQRRDLRAPSFLVASHDELATSQRQLKPCRSRRQRRGFFVSTQGPAPPLTGLRSPHQPGGTPTLLLLFNTQKRTYATLFTAWCLFLQLVLLFLLRLYLIRCLSGPWPGAHLLACRWSGRAYSTHERVARHCPPWKSDATQQKLWRETDFWTTVHTRRVFFGILLLGFLLFFNPGSSTSCKGTPVALNIRAAM